MNLDTITGNVFLLDQYATFTQTKCHDRTDKSRISNNRRTDVRFINMVDQRRIGQAARIMNLRTVAFLIVNLIRHIRNGRDHIHIELTVQTFLHNLHMQQPLETTTETKAQCR